MLRQTEGEKLRVHAEEQRQIMHTTRGQKRTRHERVYNKIIGEKASIQHVSRLLVHRTPSWGKCIKKEDTLVLIMVQHAEFCAIL